MATDLRSGPENLDIYDPHRYVGGVPHDVFEVARQPLAARVKARVTGKLESRVRAIVATILETRSNLDNAHKPMPVRLSSR